MRQKNFPAKYLLDLSVARKREVMSMASHKFSVPLLCDVIGLARSSFYYKSQASDDSELRRDIEGVCLRYTRYGYRRVLGRLQRKG